MGLKVQQDQQVHLAHLELLVSQDLWDSLDQLVRQEAKDLQARKVLLEAKGSLEIMDLPGNRDHQVLKDNLVRLGQLDQPDPMATKA